MSLLILYTMLTAHLKKPKALIVKAFQELTTNLIGQALNDGRFNKTSVQQNLNILVLLMSVRVAAYKYNMFDLKPSLAFIC